MQFESPGQITCGWQLYFHRKPMSRRTKYNEIKHSTLGNVRFARSKPRLTSINTPNHVTPPVSSKLVLRCGLFTFVAANTLFVGSVVCGYETWRRRLEQNKQKHKTRGFLSKIQRFIESYMGRSFRASDVYWIIVACNALVFLAHKSPFGPAVLRYFSNSPYGPTPALSMLLSVFSHNNLWHLAINMYVLHSFTSTLIMMVGVEDYLSLFIGGGIFASFISLLNKATRRSVIPSLGASGGICAILGAFCMLQPHARLCVPFVVDIIPHSFPAHNAAWTLLMFEFTASIFLAARSPLDHAAHMGGLAFGMIYGMLGVESAWKRRHAIIAWWKNIRKL